VRESCELPVSEMVLQDAEKRFRPVVLKVFTVLPYKPKHCQLLLYKRNKKQLHKFHTTWVWFQVSFQELPQGKIKTLTKNNFTKEQFEKIAKEIKNDYTKRIYKQILCVE